MNITRIGLDLAKNVFQVHGVDRKDKPIVRKQLKRAQMHSYFKKLSPCTIGIEACGTSHYWARELSAMGHTVKLIPAQHVKPYLKHNKNDANDAAAICEAISRPDMQFVAIKTVEQQVEQAIHRIRTRLIKSRTALANEIRSYLSEFGIILPIGIVNLRQAIPVLLEQDHSQLPIRFLSLLAELGEELRQIDARIAAQDKRLEQSAKQDERIQRLLKVEGIGPVSASALIAAVDNATQFKTGRDMAAWIGLVPKQHSSGGKNRLGSISKKGDPYLRTLLIQGGQAVLNASIRKQKQDRRSQWACSLAARSHKNIAAVAIANKNVRIAWAILSREEKYRDHPIR